MKQFLSEAEKGKITQFLADDMMREAVKKVLLFSIYNAETLKEGEPAAMDKHWVYGITSLTHVSDEQIGRLLRVKVDACSLLEEGYKSLAEYKQFPKQEKKVLNTAR